MAAPQCVPSPIATPRTALPASEARQTRGEFRAVLQAGRSPAAMRVAPPTLPHAERGSWTLAILQRDHKSNSHVGRIAALRFTEIMHLTQGILSATIPFMVSVSASAFAP